MNSIALIVYWVCQLYTLVLIARVILDFTQILARDWQPTGFLMVAANFVYRLTDPPLRFLGRYIPPLRLGAVALDMGFLVLFIGVQVINNIALRFI